MRARLKLNGPIPAVDPKGRRPAGDIPVATYDEIRRTLRSTREGLGLTIREVEEIAGAATDHFAKVEKDTPTTDSSGRDRSPNVHLLIEWCQALGFELVLRPVPMSPLALRVVCDTRRKLEARNKRFALEAERRAGGPQS